MTHAPENGAINRLHFWRRVFVYHLAAYIWILKWKFLAPKINMAESDVDDEFAESAAIIIAGIIAKGTVMNSTSPNFDTVN